MLVAGPGSTPNAPASQTSPTSDAATMEAARESSAAANSPVGGDCCGVVVEHDANASRHTTAAPADKAVDPARWRGPSPLTRRECTRVAPASSATEPGVLGKTEMSGPDSNRQ